MYYLADAAFLVGVEGDRGVLEELYEGLRKPKTMLYLGRYAYHPSLPVWIKDGLVDEPLEKALRSYPLLTKPSEPFIRMVVEVGQGEKKVRDVPVQFGGPHQNVPRFVTTLYALSRDFVIPDFLEEGPVDD
jgi:CRISPR system Cascade subunit CasD